MFSQIGDDIFKEAADGRYKVVFCDTDCLPALETKRGDRTTNEAEAALIKQVLHLLTQLTPDRRFTS